MPFIVTVAIWFVATGLIAWADNRERATFSTSLMIGSVAGIAGLLVILVCPHLGRDVGSLPILHRRADGVGVA